MMASVGYWEETGGMKVEYLVGCGRNKQFVHLSRFPHCRQHMVYDIKLGTPVQYCGLYRPDRKSGFITLHGYLLKCIVSREQVRESAET